MGLFLILTYYLIMGYHQKKVRKQSTVLKKMDIGYFLLKLPSITCIYGQIAPIIGYFKYKEREHIYMNTYIFRQYLCRINNFKSI